MDIPPVNKTEIISYETVPLFSKLWNVSKPLRKRLNWLLKGKRVTIRLEEDKTGTKLTLDPSKQFDTALKELKTKISEDKDYFSRSSSVSNQEEADMFLQKTPEKECSLSLKNPIKPAYFRTVSKLYFYDEERHRGRNSCDHSENYLNLRFGHVGCLQILSVEGTSEIQQVINNIESTDHLELDSSQINKELDFSKVKINKVSISQAFFEEKLKFPNKFNYLWFNECGPHEFLEFSQIEKVGIGAIDLDEEMNIVRRLKSGIKCKEITDVWDLDFFEYFPSSVRKLEIEDDIKAEKMLTKARFPYLFSVKGNLSVSQFEKLNLRTVPSQLEGKFKGKFKARPREITVSTTNSDLLNGHPELFENVSRVKIMSGYLNCHLLPSKLNFLYVYDACEKQIKSKQISRFEGKFKENKGN